MRGKFLAAIVVLILPVAALAHHGNAAFDTSKTLTLKATVTEWFWANPHCILQFDVKDENGQAVHWVGEGDNPPNLVNRGWAVDSFKPGDQVTVTLQPVKNGKTIGRLTQVTLASGKILGGGGGGPEPGAATGGNKSQGDSK